MNRSMIGAVLGMLLSIGSLAHAGAIGPMEPYAAGGDLLLGAAYTYGSTTLSHGDDDFTVMQNQVSVEARYNRVGNVESCLRIGAAEARTSDTAPGFRGGPAALVSGELRWLAWSDGAFGMGTFFQVTDALPAFRDGDRKIKDFTEILGGVGVQAKAGPAVVYAGPFAY